MRPSATMPMLEHREALTLYLDSLFRDVADETDAMDQTLPKPVAPVATVTAVVTPTDTPIAEQQPAAIPVSAIPTAPLNCALLRVGELRLAMPLVELHGIRRQHERLCRLPNLPVWILGVSTVARGSRVQVVDTASLLARAPVEYNEMHIVTVAPDRWALACDGIEKTLRVDPAEVRWRPQRGAEPWFAGVVAGELCAFIDVPALVAWLDAGAGGSFTA